MDTNKQRKKFDDKKLKPMIIIGHMEHRNKTKENENSKIIRTIL